VSSPPDGWYICRRIHCLDEVNFRASAHCCGWICEELKVKTTNLAFGAIAMLAISAAAWSHGEADHKAAPHRSAATAAETDFGRPVDPRKAKRTIDIDMSDAMRFTPAKLAIRRGESIRFLVRNSGRTPHEMVLGTMKELREHAAIMKKFPEMEHEEPHMAHVKPGATETIGWQFTRAGTFYYGCLVPGHLEAGMVGRITVRR
jgi:uncharacterized cupredoxin-like copper-binding protein